MQIKKLKQLFENVVLQITLAGICILIYNIPFLHLGGDSTIMIHDNLDSNLSWVKMLLDNSLVFSPPAEEVNQVFNGLPRYALYGTIDLSLLWFHLFGMFDGYIVNKIVMGFIGFLGMYLLLKNHFNLDKQSTFIPWFTGLLFGLLPYWSFTLTVSGIPLVLYAFLNLRCGDDRWFNWAIIILFAFYSSLVLSGIFLFTILLIIYIKDLKRNKIIFSRFFIGMFLLGIFYILSHYPLIFSTLNSDSFVSHRTSFDLKPWTLEQSLKQIKQIFVFGQYHAHSLHQYMLITIVIGAILSFRSKQKKVFWILVLFLAITSIFYGLHRWEVIWPSYNKLFQLFPIQLQRFHFLHPTAWYLLFGISLYMIKKRIKYSEILITIILLIQLGFVLKNHELITQKNNLTFNEFYSPTQFELVSKLIDKPQKDYRVISIGLHPSIAQYNGFSTLDGYFPNYPMQYKESFRKVIAGELAKDSYLSYYYDSWGSRCYAFNTRTRRNHLKNDHPAVKDLDFNYKHLKSLGGTHLLSSVEINTDRNNNLKFVGSVIKPEFYWKIYVYENIADSE